MFPPQLRLWVDSQSSQQKVECLVFFLLANEIKVFLKEKKIYDHLHWQLRMQDQDGACCFKERSGFPAFPFSCICSHFICLFAYRLGRCAHLIPPRPGLTAKTNTEQTECRTTEASFPNSGMRVRTHTSCLNRTNRNEAGQNRRWEDTPGSHQGSLVSLRNPSDEELGKWWQNGARQSTGRGGKEHYAKAVVCVLPPPPETMCNLGHIRELH